MSKYKSGDEVIFHRRNPWEYPEINEGVITSINRNVFGKYKYLIEYRHHSDDCANWFSEKRIIRKNKAFYRDLHKAIDILIAKEISICNKEDQPTSRLTSLSVKINDLFKEE